MLTYTWCASDAQIMAPIKWRSAAHTTLYDPPIEEFSVLLTDLQAGETETHDPIDGPSIFIATSGNGKVTWKEHGEKDAEGSLDKPGGVFFVGAGAKVAFKAGPHGLTVYRAFVEA